ncbi:MAG: hypothetical protein MAG453_01460 [Calditrichaeota bacterium]|nr:hypothetical protein [Calditrichota bacterium]
MRDLPKIIIGLAIFVIIVAIPLWYNLAGGGAGAMPELVVETEDVPGRDECVLPAGRMRPEHMDLLNRWRDEYVRYGDRDFTDHRGRTFEKSLTKTCLDCHANKDTFCDRCHNYMAVDPYCWDCHVVPEELAGRGGRR